MLSGVLDVGDYYLRIHSDSVTSAPDYLVSWGKDQGYEELRGQCASAPEDIDDPLFGCQWNLVNDGSVNGVKGININVLGAWAITQGEGIRVAVIDTGTDPLHEDLRENIIHERNYNFFDDSPDVFSGSAPVHGTSAMGLVAARDNDLGFRGVAPRARVFSHKTLHNGRDTEIKGMARAYATGRVTTEVSTSSVGNIALGVPSSLSELEARAIDAGLSEGAGGKGVVYVHAADNGHFNGVMTTVVDIGNHYGIIPVCAVHSGGVRASYSIKGPGLWVCAPSGDRIFGLLAGVTTTLPDNEYQLGFSGTSAAAPQVAGVVALVRSANPSLTWRDVKLILAASARKIDPTDTGWVTGALQWGSATDRYDFNHSYGFGLVDATAAVELALNWVPLNEMQTTTASSTTVLSIPVDGTEVSGLFGNEWGVGHRQGEGGIR